MGTRPQRRVSQLVSMPAPTGGLNDIDPLANMGSEFCLDLVNFFPSTGSLQLRRGYKEWVTELGAPVRTLMRYARADGSEELFACTDAGIYDVSLSTDTPVLVAALSAGVVNHAQFTNVAGNYLVACNGVDPVWLYNGTTWTAFVDTVGPVDPGEISGVDPSTLFGVLPYKNRLWFLANDSMTGWYLPLDAVAGVAEPFYFGAIFKRGGAAYQLASWSFDSGIGLDDKLVVHTTSGEVAIYSGNDPADAADWRLDAVFFVSAPIGTKANSELGGDVLLLTRAGVIPISTMVKGEVNLALADSAVSKRISRTLNAIVNSSGYTPNWEIHNIPTLQATVIFIPSSGSAPAGQFVMNNLTGAWTKYTLPARCAGVYGGKVYFGTDDGKVMAFGDVETDGVLLDGTSGVPVTCGLFSAFNYLGDPTTNKHYKFVRPIFQATVPPGYLLRVSTDYDVTPTPGNPPSGGAKAQAYLWDAALWGSAFWASSSAVYRPWTGVLGMGFCAAVQLKITAEAAANLVALEVAFESGASI